MPLRWDPPHGPPPHGAPPALPIASHGGWSGAVYWGLWGWGGVSKGRRHRLNFGAIFLCFGSFLPFLSPFLLFWAHFVPYWGRSPPHLGAIFALLGAVSPLSSPTFGAPPSIHPHHLGVPVPSPPLCCALRATSLRSRSFRRCAVGSRLCCGGRGGDTVTHRGTL